MGREERRRPVTEQPEGERKKTGKHNTYQHSVQNTSSDVGREVANKLPSRYKRDTYR